MAAPPTNDRDDVLDELAFRVFLLVSAADDRIDAREVDIFRRMMSNPRWCHSTVVQEHFVRVDENFHALWKKLAAGEPNRNTTELRQMLTAVRSALDCDERSALSRDLRHLGRSIARASGGVLGLGSVSREEKHALDILDLIYQEELLAGASASAGAGADAGADATLADDRAIGEGAGDRRTVAWDTSPLWTKGRLEVRCVRIIDETHDVKTFRFIGTTMCRFSYKPGQFCTLELDVDGQKVLRSYTISSSPSRPHILEITVKRVPGGLVSNWLHDHLCEGQVVHIAGPAGKFSWLFEQPDKVFLVSGGSGITPVMSMARFLYDTGQDIDIVFLHSACTEADLIFRRELELLEGRHPTFRLRWALTREAPDNWDGFRGRLSTDIIRAAASDFMERTVYLCGPNPFMAAVKGLFEEMAFPMERYHAESFGGAPSRAPTGEAVLFDSLLRKFPVPAPCRPARPAPRQRKSTADDTSPARVVFAQSGEEALCGDKTILEAAEEAGIDIANACRSGGCGTCRVALLAGTVDMSCEDGLDPDELDAGYVLTCVARARGRVEVDA